MGLAEDGNSTEAEGAKESGDSESKESETDAGEEEGHKKKVLGATGKDVFGGKNSSVVGFLGFSKKEPTLLGIPMPIVMFLFVLTVTISCLTIGCCIARKTDILKVNKEEVGGPARPVDEEEDTKGYDWRK
mmetsp:Transcript_20399/g.31862  ORF Transcript_20399/g.31862 Transcript_20399/m.31862 type:complete len:131 (-) Transcript_20399:203-595(-)